MWFSILKMWLSILESYLFYFILELQFLITINVNLNCLYVNHDSQIIKLINVSLITSLSFEKCTIKCFIDSSYFTFCTPSYQCNNCFKLLLIILHHSYESIDGWIWLVSNPWESPLYSPTSWRIYVTSMYEMIEMLNAWFWLLIYLFYIILYLRHYICINIEIILARRFLWIMFVWSNFSIDDHDHYVSYWNPYFHN